MTGRQKMTRGERLGSLLLIAVLTAIAVWAIVDYRGGSRSGKEFREAVIEYSDSAAAVDRRVRATADSAKKALRKTAQKTRGKKEKNNSETDKGRKGRSRDIMDEHPLGY